MRCKSRLTQRQSHGLSFVLGYTYSHALAENYDNWSYVVPINSAQSEIDLWGQYVRYTPPFHGFGDLPVAGEKDSEPAPGRLVHQFHHAVPERRTLGHQRPHDRL